MCSELGKLTRYRLPRLVPRRFRSHDVLSILAELFLRRGIPAHIRSVHGLQCIASQLRHWLTARQIAPLSIEPGAPWENGQVESGNGTMREEGLHGARFDTLKEAQIMTERERTHDHMVRPPRRLGGQPPAPETVQRAS